MKIVIIGAGNGGVWTALHYAYFTRNDKNIEVEVIYDPEIDSFPVGQGLFPGQSGLLYDACGINWYHNEVHATPKLGILYENWSKKIPNLFHEFPFNHVAMQADPKCLQKYILNSGLFAVKERNITDLDTVEADVIFDCRGNTKKDDIEYESLYCPLNSVLLAISTMHDSTQNWTRAVATLDGWTFVIPNTTDTTSYGYLYNKDITPLETAKTNFSELFGKEFPNEMKTFNLPFESYLAKEPLRLDSNGRKIILNGNRLAFLEPMEATAIDFYGFVSAATFDWVMGGTEYSSLPSNFPNNPYRMKDVTSNINKMIHEIHTFILWHYTKGSVYDTPFWREAQAKTTAIFEQPNENFQDIVNLAKSMDLIDLRSIVAPYGAWGAVAIKRWYDGYIK